MKGPVFLTGMMGSGKTTVGRRLAVLLGWAWVDLDRAVEKRAKMPVPTIFKTRGEAAFRRLESAELARLAGRSALVVSCGGGAVLSAANRRVLKQALTLYLAASPETLRRRLAGPEARRRPLLQGGDPLAALRRLQRERARFYRASARSVLRAGAKPEAVAQRAFQIVRGTLTPTGRRASLLKP